MDRYAVRSLEGSVRATVSVPGSKSQTNRALLLAALAVGRSTLHGALFSDDTRVFVDALRRLGLTVEDHVAAANITVEGTSGRIPATAAELYVGNAGTAARFLTAYLPLGHGSYLLDGAERMRQRPIGDLLDALHALGADLETLHGDGCPPVRVRAAGLRGGHAVVDASRSGQFLSALLMVAPYAEEDVTLTLARHLASPPYIDMTVAMMRDWGVSAVREGGTEAPVEYRVPAGQRYVARRYDVPPDASGASYFLAAAAISGGTVRVHNLGLATDQGDLGFARVLERMGCRLTWDGTDVELTGPVRLDGIDLDLNDMSDMTLTLAAIAPYAAAPVTIRNVAHIRAQETDRINAVVTELRRLGATVQERPDGLTVIPSPLHGASIHTYGDHRMAMAFAVTGLRTPGVLIEDPGCVAKTFPDFFERLETLYPGG